MMNTGFGIAGVISPWVFGFLIDRTGSYTLPFVITSALLLIGAASAMFIDPTKRIDVVELPKAGLQPSFRNEAHAVPPIAHLELPWTTCARL